MRSTSRTRKPRIRTPTSTGESSAAMNSSDPSRVRSQKESTAGPPTTGRATAPSRPSSSCQVTGCAHWVFVFGPVGPLLNEGAFSPQRPVKSSHANSPLGVLGQHDDVGPDLDALRRGCCRSRTRRRRSSRTTATACSTRRAIPGPGTRRHGRRPAAASGRPTAAVSEPSCWANAALTGEDCSASVGRVGLEEQLDHLPVALVPVVPVVEDPPEPVLEGEHPGVIGVGADAGVDRGCVLRALLVEPLLVVALG